ncbi:MAG: hypothetical protein AAFW75_24595 [Cyanobacteria bacterium J06636_16]
MSFTKKAHQPSAGKGAIAVPVRLLFGTAHANALLVGMSSSEAKNPSALTWEAPRTDGLATLYHAIPSQTQVRHQAILGLLKPREKKLGGLFSDLDGTDRPQTDYNYSAIW